jgi:DNA (cytosine-5)-methyltransferase 1
MTRLSAFSLFSGVGGMDLGFDRAGIPTIAQCEIDPKAASVLRRHWPDVPVINDVREVTSMSGVEVIHGGFPCQDVSIGAASSRKGLEGERSKLWWEFHRILEEVRPRWCVIENVTGLLSSNRGRDMGAILGALGELGYGYAYRVLDARYFGVPQRRRRVFIVGHLGGRGAVEVLLEPEGLCWSAEKVQGTRENTASKTRTIFDHDGNGIPRITGTLASSWANGVGNTQVDCGILVPHELGARRITLRECERLMSWPDDWTRWGDDGKEISDTQRYKMCGNGVVSNVAQWVAERIVLAD